MRTVLLTIFLLVTAGSTFATNTPCSGKKGGVAHCENGHFICNDGTISASKKVCSASAKMSAAAAKTKETLSNPTSKSPAATAKKAEACLCSDNTQCSGPKGGKYCLLPTGKKKYFSHP